MTITWPPAPTPTTPPAASLHAAPDPESFPFAEIGTDDGREDGNEGDSTAKNDGGASITKIARGYTFDELRKVRFPVRPSLLNHGQQGIMRGGDIVQMYANRGTGKSLFASTIALAIASGRKLLRWHAPEPRKVTYFDGEMPSEMLADRIFMIADRMGIKNCGNLTMVARDWQEDFLPRLDTPEGQALISPWITDETGLVIFDNASTLFDPESEKDSSAWEPAQELLLGLRRRGIASLLIHHTNRQGGARGHSRREDIMDLLIRLVRPEGYVQEQGARFTVEFDKTRGFYGAAAESFVASLEDGGWVERDSENGRGKALAALTADILEFFRANPGASKKAAEDNVVGRAKAIRDRVDDLSVDGQLVKKDGGYYVR